MLLLLSKTILPSMVLLIGVFRFHNMNKAFRSIFFQVFAYVVLLTLTKQVMIFQKLHGLERNTHFLYNCYTPLETLLLLYAAYNFFHNRFLKMFSVVAASLFSLIYVLELVINGLNEYAKYSDTIANLLLLLLFAIVLYIEFQHNANTWYRSSVIWVSTGIIVFAASTFTYMSLSDYLEYLNPKLNKLVYRTLFGVMANLRYFCIGLAFWFIRSSSLNQASNASV